MYIVLPTHSVNNKYYRYVRFSILLGYVLCSDEQMGILKKICVAEDISQDLRAYIILFSRKYKKLNKNNPHCMLFTWAQIVLEVVLK